MFDDSRKVVALFCSIQVQGLVLLHQEALFK